MEKAISRLQPHTDDNTYILEPNTMLAIMNFNVTWQSVINQTKSSRPDASLPTTYIIPAFSGHHANGHWFFSILLVSNTKNTVYMHDTLAYSPDKTSLVQAFYDKIGRPINQWKFTNCIPQCELECGPRTITSIHDVLSQLNAGHDVDHAMQRIEKYDISDNEYATHARRWLYDMVTNDDFDARRYAIPR